MTYDLGGALVSGNAAVQTNATVTAGRPQRTVLFGTGRRRVDAIGQAQPGQPDPLQPGLPAAGTCPPGNVPIRPKFPSTATHTNAYLSRERTLLIQAPNNGDSHSSWTRSMLLTLLLITVCLYGAAIGRTVVSAA